MKKRLLTLAMLALVMTSAKASVEINPTNFPDESFRTAIMEWANTDGDNTLSDEELAAVITWELHDVENFKGLEYFTSLETIWIGLLWKEGPLNATNLDLSALKNLWRIGIGGYNITSFDVSANTKVTDLEIADCPKLASIKAPANVEEFTFTNLPSLASVDFSLYKKLWKIAFRNVGVQDFDFSSHPAIANINLYGSEEELYTLNSINVAGCPELYEISFEWTKTQSIRLKNLQKLYALAVNNCETALIAVEDMPELGGITCENSDIKELNIKSCPELTGIDCNSNFLKVLIVDDSPKLGTVYAKDNQLMWLDLQYVKNEEGGIQNWFNVEGQQPRATAYKLKSDAVGLKVHERFEKERMLNLKTNSKDMTPDWLTVDGVKYLVITTDGSTADNLKNKKAEYKYETKWPFPWAGENPEDNNMPVELTLSGVEKLNSWIKFKTTDFDEPLKGEEGGTLVGATPEDIARSDYYDGALAFTSSDKDVVSVNATTGALTLVGGGVATITISGAETYYRNAPKSIGYKVIVIGSGDANGDGRVDANDIVLLVNYMMGKVAASSLYLKAADANKDGKIDAADIVWIVNKITSVN